ncbi:MAG: major capsid protein [Microvirus sp.]|nr:MAG: major capsid protein [Microvirus sp.]
MEKTMFRNKSANQNQFAMVARADVPRSRFPRQTTHKTTINAGFLYPFFIDECLPGDTFNVKATIFGRLSTPLVPIIDNIYADTFYFFVPNRIVWDNWVRMQGEQDNPADSISFVVPQSVSPTSGYLPLSLHDYFGLPTVGVLGTGNTFSHSALPLRAYNLIWNDWFRDQNLQNSVPVALNDGPDPNTNYTLLRRGKRKDYFTSCLPFAQKGAAVTLPLGTSAPIRTTSIVQVTGAQQSVRFSDSVAGAVPTLGTAASFNGTGQMGPSGLAAGSGTGVYPNNLIADLSAATAATVNSLRLSFQIQKLLERDARGGTRYSEMLQAHFGVRPQDYRLQRPEYLGGGSTPVNINPIAQTQATGATGTSTPLGQLAAMGTLVSTNNGFRYSVMEHGHIIGLVSIRSDLTYQQGVRKLWNRSTRYDFYMPEFAMLGEQAVLNREIYARGDANDLLAFGFQERWAEYRYFPNLITGQFRSTTATPLDIWHLAQNFTSLPTLNATFIQENPPINRIVAVPSQPQFLLDIFMNIDTVRPLPMYSVPGLIDHF